LVFILQLINKEFGRNHKNHGMQSVNIDGSRSTANQQITADAFHNCFTTIPDTQTQIVEALKSLPIIRIRFPVLWNRHTKISSLVLNVTVKGKTWTGPEGSRKMRLPDFKTVGT